MCVYFFNRPLLRGSWRYDTVQTRQLNVMNEEERAKKLQQVAKREEELEFKARVQAAYRELMSAKSRSSM